MLGIIKLPQQLCLAKKLLSYYLTKLLNKLIVIDNIYFMFSGEYVKAREIFLISLLFTLSFMVTEIIISAFTFNEALKRFILRIAFLVQYSVIIYYLFDYRDKKRNLRNHEDRSSETEKKPLNNDKINER